MGIFLFLIAIFIVTKHPNLTIFSMSAFIITFQASNGALFWVYVSDIGTEATFGLCLFTLMVMLLLQSLTALPLMNSSWCGVDGMFFGLAAFQMVTVVHLWAKMKETRGLSEEQKKSLFKPEGNKI